MRCILYPGQKIVVVAPTKPQSLGFVKKIREFLRDSPNLSNEIDVNNIKTGANECEIPFRNGSMIFTKVHSENARGEFRPSTQEYVDCIGEENWKAEMLIRVEGYVPTRRA